MKIAALEWKEYPGSRLNGESKERYGFHEFGYYVVTRSGGSYHLSTFTNMGKMRPIGSFKLLAAAQDAAQVDYADRLRSCSVPEPVGDAVGFRDEPWVRNEDRRKQDAARSEGGKS